MNVVPSFGLYILGAVSAIATGGLIWAVRRALKIGVTHGSRSGGFSRTTEPIWYWFIVVMQCAGIAWFGFIALIIAVIGILGIKIPNG